MVLYIFVFIEGIVIFICDTNDKRTKTFHIKRCPSEYVISPFNDKELKKLCEINEYKNESLFKEISKFYGNIPGYIIDNYIICHNNESFFNIKDGFINKYKKTDKNILIILKKQIIIFMEQKVSY